MSSKFEKLYAEKFSNQYNDFDSFYIDTISSGKNLEFRILAMFSRFCEDRSIVNNEYQLDKFVDDIIVPEILSNKNPGRNIIIFTWNLLRLEGFLSSYNSPEKLYSQLQELNLFDKFFYFLEHVGFFDKSLPSTVNSIKEYSKSESDFICDLKKSTFEEFEAILLQKHNFILTPKLDGEFKAFFDNAINHIKHCLHSEKQISVNENRSFLFALNEMIGINEFNTDSTYCLFILNKRLKEQTETIEIRTSILNKISELYKVKEYHKIRVESANYLSQNNNFKELQDLLASIDADFLNNVITPLKSEINTISKRSLDEAISQLKNFLVKNPDWKEGEDLLKRLIEEKTVSNQRSNILNKISELYKAKEYYKIRVESANYLSQNNNFKELRDLLASIDADYLNNVITPLKSEINTISKRSLDEAISQLKNFLIKNPDWEEGEKLLKRLSQALMKEISSRWTNVLIEFAQTGNYSSLGMKCTSPEAYVANQDGKEIADTFYEAYKEILKKKWPQNHLVATLVLLAKQKDKVLRLLDLNTTISIFVNFLEKKYKNSNFNENELLIVNDLYVNLKDQSQNALDRLNNSSIVSILTSSLQEILLQANYDQSVWLLKWIAFLPQSEVKLLLSKVKSAHKFQTDIDNTIKNQPKASYIRNIEDSLVEETSREYLNTVRIGEIKVYDKLFPVMFPLFKEGGIAVIMNQENSTRIFSLFQNIVLRIVFSFPNQHIKIRIIDADQGISFPLLLGLPKEIIGKGVYYDDKLVMQLFDELKKRDSEIIFNNLRNSFKSLVEYNITVRDSYEPLEVFVINGFPYLFNEQFIDYITNSVKRECRTGAYFLIAYDENNYRNNDKLINSANKLLDLIPVVNSDFKFNNTEEFLRTINLPINCQHEIHLDDEISVPDYAINKYGITLKSPPSQQTEQSKDLQSDQFNNTSAIDGIKILVGYDLKGRKTFLNIGNETGAYHGIICGTTGSGKTVLLHQIILEGAKKYLADELQFVLLDYKEGNGFQVYRNLPHARIIAIDADIDFGLESLKFVSDTIKLRAAEFKKYDAKDLNEYRKKAEIKLPRLLIIIDEFQVLLSGQSSNSNKHEQIKKIMEDIVRLGRSYGIHLLLATQTPSGVKWEYSTLENIAIRIGLRMSQEAESYLFKHSKYIASQFTERFGKAVYNDKSGVESESIIFNIKPLNEETIAPMVSITEIKARETKTYPEERTVFIANQTVLYKGNDLKLAEWRDENLSIHWKIGQAATIKLENTEVVQDAKQMTNIITLGSKENVVLDLLVVYFYNFICSSKRNSKIKYYCTDSERMQFVKSFFFHIGEVEWIDDNNKFVEAIIASKKELDEKISSNTVERRELFIIDGMNKLDEIGKFKLDGEWGDELKTVIEKLLTTGVKYNTIFWIWAEEKGIVERAFNIRAGINNMFAHAVSVQGINNKFVQDLSSSYELNDNMGIYYKRSTGKETKFNAIKI